MRRECRERFPRHRRISDPSQWREQRSRYSRRMRNPQFYVSDKRPIEVKAWVISLIPSFYVDVITYPCPKLNADVEHTC